MLPAGLVPTVLDLVTQAAPPASKGPLDLASAVAVFSVYDFDVVCPLRTCGNSSLDLPKLRFPRPEEDRSHGLSVLETKKTERVTSKPPSKYRNAARDCHLPETCHFTPIRL